MFNRLGRIFTWVIYVLGSVTLLLLLLGGIAAWQGWRHIEPALPDNMVLGLDLRNGLAESEYPSPWQEFFGDSEISTRQAVMAIFDAAIDDRVQGLLLRVDSSPLGLAQAQELRQAMLYFRSFDKKIHVFADSFGIEAQSPNAYVVAAAADEIWMQPSGDWAMLGFLWQVPYLQPLLARLGIKAEFLTREEYKSAMHSFTQTGMSAAEKSAIREFGENILDQKKSMLIADRNLDAATAGTLMEQSPLLAEQAAKIGLVTRLGYVGEWRQNWQTLYGPDTVLVPLGDYALSPPPAGAAQVAVITINGVIERGQAEREDYWQSGDAAFAEDIVRAIRDAAEDTEIRAIILRINSPGGSYIASDSIWFAVQQAKSKKPVYAVMGDVAASGGYFAAMGADKIFASPGTITGSIGVVIGKFSLAGSMEKLGIRKDGVQLGAQADLWSPLADFSPQGRAKIEEFLDKSYQDFLTKAASGRGMDVTEIRNLSKGRIWTGEQAAALNLIDGTGGWLEAEDNLYPALNLADDDSIDYIAFPRGQDPWTEILMGLGGWHQTAQASARLWQEFSTIIHPPRGVQLRM